MNDFKLNEEKRISSGFTLPDGYFDSFGKRLTARMPETQPAVITLWGRSKKWIYTAAAVVVLSVSIPVVDYFRATKQPQDVAEVENYLSYQSTITDDDLIELLSHEAAETPAGDAESAALEEILTDNAHLEDYITN